jgi:hypothetical protein
MTRVTGWEVRLAAAIEEARGAAFAWGEMDCATWAFDVRFALTGDDAAAAWRGRYRTERGAMRMLRQLGCCTPADLAQSILGAPLPTPLLAQRGDIVATEDALGVCIGQDCAFLAPSGLTLRPLAAVQLAWRV